MSVIHEALRRARQSRPTKNGPSNAPTGEKPALTVRSSRQAPAWLGWLLMVFVLAEGALYLRERSVRLHSEDKMRAAYLALNDTRGDTTEEIRRLKVKLNEAERSKTAALNVKQSVEFDNLRKEKKVSELTKEMHLAEMSKYRLQDEVKALKAELAKLSSANAPEPPSK